jgi:hypothetical protein
LEGSVEPRNTSGLKHCPTFLILERGVLIGFAGGIQQVASAKELNAALVANQRRPKHEAFQKEQTHSLR